MINEIEPYCFSIVDTFGSMYQEDLHRIFEIINHHLISTCRIGFHSHNNMQLSNSLAQEFVRLSTGKRKVVVDGALNGMGRGAGNTPTELIAQYMVSKLGYTYDMDVLLDTMDEYMDNIRTRCSWGYDIPYFLAGCYSAHINNILYLKAKSSIKSKDMAYVLNKIGSEKRKRYDYNLLEETFTNMMESEIDDTLEFENLSTLLNGRKVLLLVPGRTTCTDKDKIINVIAKEKPVVISINFIHDEIESDYVYMSNIRRYEYWKDSELFKETKKIYTSNIKYNESEEKSEVIVLSFLRLIKRGVEQIDNSTIMLLRLMDQIGIKNLYIAGFDGFGNTTDNGDFALE